MEEQCIPVVQQQAAKPKMIPNSLAALICGISSIVMMCYLGWILGIIALSQWKKAKAKYDANPGLYSEASLKMGNSGRICGIIGIITGILGMIFWVIYIIVIGAVVGTHSYHF